MYILTLLSRGPESGYSIIRRIDDRTEGAWRPGPGTMYPLLKSLTKERLVRPAGDGRGGGAKTYVLTSKGRRSLEDLRRTITGVGRKEGVMAHLFSELLPGDILAKLIVKRFRDASPIFREKVVEMPKDEREAALREYELLLGSELDWVRSKTGKR
jgi:DNA-binding PadR family transcriptional regulator